MPKMNKVSPKDKTPLKTSLEDTSAPKKKLPLKTGRKLSLRQERFCQEYVKNNGNATKAAQLAYPEARPKTTAPLIGYENIRKPVVKNRIDQILNDNDLSLEYSIKKIRQLTEYEKPIIVGKSVQSWPDGGIQLEATRTALKLHRVLDQGSISIDNRTLNLGLVESDLKGIGNICAVLREMNNQLALSQGEQSGEVVDVEVIVNAEDIGT